MKVKNMVKLLSEIHGHWQPHVVGELNGQHVKLAKLKGEFVWHKHDHEDEMFYVLKGVLRIAFRDREEMLTAGDFIIVPKGVEHKPEADEEVHVLLFEPAGTLNTGDQINDLTQNELRKL